jgi:hypothetical protein
LYFLSTGVVHRWSPTNILVVWVFLHSGFPHSCTTKLCSEACGSYWSACIWLWGETDFVTVQCVSQNHFNICRDVTVCIVVNGGGRNYPPFDCGRFESSAAPLWQSKSQSYSVCILSTKYYELITWNTEPFKIYFCCLPHLLIWWMFNKMWRKVIYDSYVWIY